LAASVDHNTMARALEIVEQLPDIKGTVPLPIREVQTLAMELDAARARQRPRGHYFG